MIERAATIERIAGWLQVAGLAAGLCLTAQAAEPKREAADTAQYRAWIEEMKASSRGPFDRIRWFCADGKVLPPKAYACKDHGGGRQHGEWTERTKTLRSNGYYIANVYAAVDVEELVARPDRRDVLAQMLVEQYLYSVDDWWILRKARYYRGAFQEEAERAGTRSLLLALAADSSWLEQNYFLLRSAVLTLDFGEETPSVAEMRRLAADLSDRDEGFKRHRYKIHSRPSADDASLVRAYAAGIKDAELVAEYQRLADIIDAVYQPGPVVDQLRDVAKAVRDYPSLAAVLNEGGKQLATTESPIDRYLVSGVLMAAIRDRATVPQSPALRLELLNISLRIEDEHFTSATELVSILGNATRRQRLAFAQASVEAIYGSGLITVRQRQALREELQELRRERVMLSRYKSKLDYLALVPAWTTQWLKFYLGPGMAKLAEIEPKANLYIQDALRTTAVFFYAKLMDRSLRDANLLAGVRQDLFGVEVGGRLRGLNPGVASGTLVLALDGKVEDFRSDGIYVLPETVADLPPVAGIITAGEGNALSHVQLLARNLGIPNVAVDETLMPHLEANDGQRVVLAVSPAGSIRITKDVQEWEKVAEEQQARPEDFLIEPDLQKLDLSVRGLIPMAELRATDSGRIVGPKAAKLGELKQHYPEAVANGLAIPFGEFRVLLDRPYGDGGDTTYKWMVEAYRGLGKMPQGSDERRQATERFRAALQDWLESVDPGPKFRDQLQRATARQFGKDGTYGVFVRSDTNVEDLPGFTGAGLNLTVVNVVGNENIVQAVPRVWASPFTARAFAWRQSHMSQPEHVYPAVLLLESVPADKSGVLVTAEIETGNRDWFSVAVNEGVGGAVDGQAAESLRVNVKTGEIKLLAQATAPYRRRINPEGGVDKVPVEPTDYVLQPAEIEKLVEFVKDLPSRFPPVIDAQGQPTPADVEFGFLDGKLKLFQIRPFLESRRARASRYLEDLDGTMKSLDSIIVNMNEMPVAGR